MVKFFKTKYYPVFIAKKIILNIPFGRDWDCFTKYKTSSVKGVRLNNFDCYKDFTILDGEDLINDM